ncbi:MAG TPA: hypothetical protein VM513_25430 [Kofleriaceae bacterium]|nr:hypothetical protein [Kofleriaceae bacterium]
MLLATSIASAEQFRPFVDEVGVTELGIIVTTTTATGQSDPTSPGRHELKVYSELGDVALEVNAEAAVHARVPIGKARWRMLDRWIGELRASRVTLQPLEELRCYAAFDPTDPTVPVCPASDGLVRTTTGIGMWNKGSPIWAWGEPRVAELERSCVLVLPHNAGSLDRYESRVVPCPPRRP